MFYDREDAARQLAKKLEHLRGKNPLVLAIPRGAVNMAKIIADKLSGDYDVVLVRKLRAPYQPELAIGSVDESGWTYIADYAASVGADNAYIENEKNFQLRTIQQRRAIYTPIRAPLAVEGRVVVVVDDGLATGASMIAALHSLKVKHTARLICAVPVSPPSTLNKIAQYADEVVCLASPDDFQAVGQFYLSFPQVDDDEVMEILKAPVE